MDSIMNLSGVPNTVLDFTNDFFPLLVCLVCLVGLSGGLIIWSAVRHYRSETKPIPRPVPPTLPRRKVGVVDAPAASDTNPDLIPRAEGPADAAGVDSQTQVH
jgi:hypothetical protein